MGRQRREFTPEYKDEAVRLVINTGRAVATVARELGINEATFGRWVNAFRACQDAVAPPTMVSPVRIAGDPATTAPTPAATTSVRAV